MTAPFTIRNQGPLEGLVILDFTTQKAGPVATYYLAAMGATVIKIEEIKGDVVRGYAPFLGSDGEVCMWDKSGQAKSLPMLARARGKHSVTLNLKIPQALEIYGEMVKRADVVIENYSSGTADRLGIGYEATNAINPRIIYCSISGFGTGVMPGRKALDLVIQAASGVMLTSGNEKDPPMRIGIAIADVVASLYATIGINAAAYRRARTGLGEYVDISMLGAMTSLLATEEWQALERLGEPTRTGNFNLKATPLGVFSCADGHVAIAAARDPMAHSLFRIIGRPEWVVDSRYATIDARSQRNDEVCDGVSAWCRTLTVEEVEAVLSVAGIPVERIRSPSEALDDPSLEARGDVTKVVHPELGSVDGLKTFGLPIVFHKSGRGTGSAAPELGEHNWLVYRDWLGFPECQLQLWKTQGVF
jgi:CoA:oxalate CoA-transferase